MTGLGYEVGATYISGYWGYTFAVVGTGDDDYGSWVTVRMISDPHSVGRVGEVWTHRTAISNNDRKLS